MEFGLGAYAVKVKEGNTDETDFVSLIYYASTLMVYLFFGFGLCYAKYSSLRYKIARVRWRGIRSRFSGRFFKFFRLMVMNYFLKFITLGLYSPKADLRLTQYLVENLSIGNVKPTFEGNPKELSSINLVTLCYLFLR